MDPSRRHLLPQDSPATLRRRRSPSPPQLRRTSATPPASQSDGGGSGGYPLDLNPSSWSLGRTVGTSSGGGSSSRTPPNAFSNPDLPPPFSAAQAMVRQSINFEGDPVSDDIVGHSIDLNELCGVTSDSEGDDGTEVGQVDNGPVDGKSIQITVLNSLVPELDSGTFVLEQPALPAPSPVACGAGRSRRRGSGASPRAGGAVKRSRATPGASHASPGEGGAGSSGASPRAGGAVKRSRATPAGSSHASPGAGSSGPAGPGSAGSNQLSIGSGASPEAGGGGNNGVSPGVGGAGSSTPLPIGSGAAALLELVRELKLSEAQTEKIITDQGLAELVLTDRGRVRSLLRNRLYAATDRKNKANREQELEQMVETLTKRISALSEELSKCHQIRTQIRTKNNELRLKLHSMEDMAQLRDARHKALTCEQEVWRAKYDAMNSHTPNTSCQEPKR